MIFHSWSSRPFADSKCDLVRESCRRFGIPMEVSTIGNFDWQGRNSCRAMADWLAGIDQSEIVFLSDLWDTFFSGRADEIERKFLDYGKDILFSAEAPPLNDDGSWGPILLGPTRWNAINGGGLMGRAGALRAMFNDPTFWRPEAHNNQVAYRYWHADHLEISTLDYYCRVWQCIYDHGGRERSIDDVLAIRDGRIYNSETDSFPCQVHGHGGQHRRLRLWGSMIFPCQSRAEHARAIRYKLRK